MPVSVVLLLVVVPVAVAYGLYFAEGPRVRRMMRKAPLRRIADWPEGQLGRIAGTIADGPALEAPLTGRRCVYYLVTVDERRRSGKRSHWSELAREERCVPFAVLDGSGRALVDPAQAQVLSGTDARSRSGTFDDPDPREAAFLARHREDGKSFFGFNQKLRYAEAVLEIGERVAVVGMPLREPDPDAVAQVSGYRDGPPTRVRVGPGPAGGPFVTDHPGTVDAP
ncbi:MAG: GIDE domain-containing protein [Kofleriaceae bacterium]